MRRRKRGRRMEANVYSVGWVAMGCKRNAKKMPLAN